MDSTFDRGRVHNELFLKRQKLPLRLLRLSDTLARCVYPLLYGYCASLYPAYGLIAEKLFRSKTMLENMPDSSLIFEPLRLLLVYILYFLGRRLAKKRAA